MEGKQCLSMSDSLVSDATKSHIVFFFPPRLMRLEGCGVAVSQYLSQLARDSLPSTAMRASLALTSLMKFPVWCASFTSRKNAYTYFHRKTCSLFQRRVITEEREREMRGDAVWIINATSRRRGVTRQHSPTSIPPQIPYLIRQSLSVEVRPRLKSWIIFQCTSFNLPKCKATNYFWFNHFIKFSLILNIYS